MFIQSCSNSTRRPTSGWPHWNHTLNSGHPYWCRQKSRTMCRRNVQ